MNWLDIVLVIINTIIILFLIFSIVMAIKEGFEWIAICVGGWLCYPILAIFTIILPFVVIDKSNGNTVGTITSVDKTLFGTTALYIKTSETTQERYCIEFNEELEEKAKELIGKQVKISYGTRVGIYSTGKCHQAPIERIEAF